MPTLRLQGEKEKKQGIYYEFNTSDEPLGEGGTGKVYPGRCVNERTGASEEVAIKFMFSDLSEDMIERARREAAITLQNDNLVKMKGFFEIQDVSPTGKVYKRYHVVSELLRGVMLSDLMHGKTTSHDGTEMPFAQQLYKDYINDPFRFSLFIIKNVLSGLMALHDAGYIHRDIDPTNIMITTDNHVKLIDFGIAKQLIQLSTFDKNLTATGQFMGKMSYAAPELALGDIKNQGKATDLYSVGILLFQCVVGHLPFEGPDNEVMRMQLNQKIPSNLIKQRALRKIIEKATAKKIENRYQSASEFRADLERIQNKPYPETGGGLKKVGLIVAACALVGAIAAFFLLNKGGGSDGPERPDTEQVATAPASGFSAVLADLKDASKAKAAVGELEKLANEGNAEATYLLSRLYFVSKSVNDYRPDSVKLMQTNSGIAIDYTKAHQLLLKTVEANPSDYRAYYELGCDYLGGESRTDAVSRDIAKADDYFTKALELAEAAGDVDYSRNIRGQMEKYQ